MANFYNSEGVLIDYAFSYPCIFEDIYISNLKEGEILISYDPSFMQNTNGMVIGIDARFTDFYVIDKNQNLVSSLKLEWLEDCKEKVQELNVEINYFYPILCVVFLTIIIIFFVKYIKRRNHESH